MSLLVNCVSFAYSKTIACAESPNCVRVVTSLDPNGTFSKLKLARMSSDSISAHSDWVQWLMRISGLPWRKLREIFSLKVNSEKKHPELKHQCWRFRGKLCLEPHWIINAWLVCLCGPQFACFEEIIYVHECTCTNKSTAQLGTRICDKPSSNYHHSF